MSERDLRKRIATLERRLATVLMVGTAEANQGARTKVRFDDSGAAGGPFSSTFLPQTSAAGNRGDGVSSFSKIGIGEPVIVFSPGGELGEHSRVMPAGPVDDHPSPGTAEADGQVIVRGNAKIEIREGLIRFTVGSSVLELKAGETVLTTGAFRGVKA